MSVDFVRHLIEHQLWMRIKARPLYLGSMTTAQRNLLPTLNGMTIYNSTTNQYEFYEAGAWRTFSPAYVPPARAMPIDIGAANAMGIAPTLSNSDHIHAHPAFPAGAVPNAHDHDDISNITFDQHHDHFARWLSNWSPYLTHLNFGSRVFGTAGKVCLNAIDVPFTVTIDMLAYLVGTQAGNIRMGLYESKTKGWPDLPDAGALIVESLSVAQQTANHIQGVTVADTQLTPEQYFIGLQGDDVTGAYWQDSTRYDHNILGVMREGRTFNQVYGAFTDPCPATAVSVAPLFFMRIKSIP